jgi:hypothetical protein
VSYRRLLTALLSAVVIPMATAALYGQLSLSQGQGQGQGPEQRPRIWVGGDRGFGRVRREPANWAERANFTGQYNFSVRLAELTYVNVKMKPDGQPDHLVLRLTDPLIYRCPVLHMEDAGTVRFSDEEVVSLRDYLLKGGFLYVDDFWGTLAWEQWSSEIGRVLPPHKYPIVDIPRDHPILHTLYDVKEVPQVPSINQWYRMGGGTSERGDDSPYVNFRAIQDEQGRLVVVMTHNTDISDTWEREGENKEYFDRFSPDGYAVGVNITLYAMTH